ncbi:dihydrofolate reductase family protein [Peribacillus frigoritolerans]|uniref:dihydrofolate reductase family protein n=1 Tax=Peribacillus frigoritolerans TaxID=450367 RepID=UPI00105A1C2F|nr:dihydrofolate reductase family protein [Peribacillus frigoritolerans]TDL80577.1 dihydrofolate reductase [Peribacillus frigoritolerans]
MSRKIVLFIAISLDGYIARLDGDISWLDEVEGAGDNGYSEFIESIDTVVMGKKTYDHVLLLTNNQYPYEGKTSYIFTRKEISTSSDLHFTTEDPAALAEKLKLQQGRDIWLVGGSELLDGFMKKNLVDEYIITTAPIILGDGIPLFKTRNSKIKLRLKSSKKYGEFVQNHYVNA